MDATSVAAPVPVLPEKARLDGLRVGIPQAYFGEGLDADVRERVMDAAHELERLARRSWKWICRFSSIDSGVLHFGLLRKRAATCPVTTA